MLYVAVFFCLVYINLNCPPRPHFLHVHLFSAPAVSTMTLIAPMSTPVHASADSPRLPYSTFPPSAARFYPVICFVVGLSPVFSAGDWY